MTVWYSLTLPHYLKCFPHMESILPFPYNDLIYMYFLYSKYHLKIHTISYQGNQFMTKINSFISFNKYNPSYRYLHIDPG